MAITCEQFDKLLDYTAVAEPMTANPVLFSSGEQNDILSECKISVKDSYNNLFFICFFPYFIL